MNERINSIGFKKYNEASEDAEFEAIVGDAPIMLIDRISDIQSEVYSTEENIQKRTKGLLVRKIGDVSFNGEFRGFLHTNVKAGNHLYDSQSGITNIPDDIECRKIPKFHDLVDPIPFNCVGMILVTSSYNVYLCYGIEDENGNIYMFRDYMY